MNLAKKYWYVLLVAAWAIYRWRAAHDMQVPLDLAFKHPFTPIADLKFGGVAYSTVDDPMSNGSMG